MNSRSILRSPADLSLYSCDFGGLDELDDSEIDFENIKFQKQILKGILKTVLFLVLEAKRNKNQNIRCTLLIFVVDRRESHAAM